MNKENTMTFYKILSALLEYPQQELLDALPEISALSQETRTLTEDERAELEKFLIYLESKSLTQLQETYVQTFDLTPEHSLHLTHHLFGDEKGRGPALIDLAEYYKSFGLQAPDNELPDYLPLILEFTSQLEEAEAHMFLSQTVKVLQQLAQNLEKINSPYASLIRLTENQGRLNRIAA
jgi:nitrate reductase delta subunit